MMEFGNNNNFMNKKKRTHPCFAMLATGCCDFGAACCFLHDQRVGNKEGFDKFESTVVWRKNHVNHQGKDDIFHWPASCSSDEYSFDHKVMYHSDLKYKSLASMWINFLRVLDDDRRQSDIDREAMLDINTVTTRRRLPMLKSLAAGTPNPSSSATFNSSTVSNSTAAAAVNKASPLQSKLLASPQSVQNLPYFFLDDPQYQQTRYKQHPYYPCINSFSSILPSSA
jgi:hypothetical protein